MLIRRQPHRATVAQSMENLDLRGQEALLTGDGPSLLSTADVKTTMLPSERTAMITQLAGPTHTHYGTQLQAHRQRIESLEQEVQKLTASPNPEKVGGASKV